MKSLCRKCGCETTKFTKCMKCNMAMSTICKCCKRIYDIQSHVHLNENISD